MVKMGNEKRAVGWEQSCCICNIGTTVCGHDAIHIHTHIHTQTHITNYIFSPAFIYFMSLSAIFLLQAICYSLLAMRCDFVSHFIKTLFKMHEVFIKIACGNLYGR